MFIKTDETIAWRHVRQARSELAAYLGTLSKDQWNQPTLCDDWLVRDVLAHLILEYRYTPADSWKDFLRSGLRVNTFMKQTAIDLGRRPTRELLKRFEDMIDEQHKPNAVSVLNVLADLLIHEQDIRIPLNQPKNMSPDALRLVFSHWAPAKFNLGEKITGVKERVGGLKFFAEDIVVTKGNGLTVRGNASDILLALAGRKVSLTRLRGEGIKILEKRLR